MASLSRVIELVQSSSSTSSADGDEEKLLNALSKLNLNDDGKSEKRGHVSGSPSQEDKEKYEPTKVAHVTKLSASFSRAMTLLTSLGQCDGMRVYTTHECLVV